MQVNRVGRGPDRSGKSANTAQVAMPAVGQTDPPIVAVPVLPSGPMESAANSSVSVPDANAIRNDVAARINAPRP